MSNRGPEKPAYLSPCNGCGYCCASEVCKVGLAMFGDDVQAPCPGLRFEGTRFVCSAVELADMMGQGAFLRAVIGIGRGCDSQTDEEIANG